MRRTNFNSYTLVNGTNTFIQETDPVSANVHLTPTRPNIEIGESCGSKKNGQFLCLRRSICPAALTIQFTSPLSESVFVFFSAAMFVVLYNTNGSADFRAI